MIDDSDQQQRRLVAKLRAIVARTHDVVAGSPELLLPDAVGIVADSGPRHAHFLTETDSNLGSLLLLAERERVDRVSIYTATSGAKLARQALLFAIDIDVSEIVPGQSEAPPAAPATPDSGLGGITGSAPAWHLRPAVPGAVVDESATSPEAILALDGAAEDDLRVISEHGEAIAELHGLQVARATGSGDSLRVEVGVGRTDQQLAAMMGGDRPSVERIREAAGQVRQYRRPGAAPHPIQRIAPERWLRDRVLSDPERWGFRRLEPVSLLEPRPGLRAQSPAAMAGEDINGRAVVAVCSVGVNPEMVVIAADLRGVWYTHAHLVLVVPEPDNHAAIQRQAGLLRHPPDIVTTPPVTQLW